MKQLTFLRHAKSDWTDEVLSDIDRPLNKRGYKDAYDGSALFLEQDMKPDALYVSTATRTISTAMIFARTLMLKSENIHLSPWYYQTTVKAILSFAQDLPDNLSHVMFVGHNPVSTDICNALLKSGSIDDIPTCGLISLHFPNSTWRTLALNSGELQYYQFPNITK